MPWHGHGLVQGRPQWKRMAHWGCHSESTRQSDGMAMCVWEGQCKPHGRAWAMGWPTRKSRSMPWHGHGWLPMKGPWNSLAHVIDNQKGTCQCHGMAMGLSKEGPKWKRMAHGIAIQKAPGKAMAWTCVCMGQCKPHGRAWPMGWPIRKRQAIPWHGHRWCQYKGNGRAWPL